MSTRNILLLGAHLSNNLGGPSIILGIIKALREHLGDCTFVVSNSFPDETAERKLAQKHGIRFVPLPNGRLNSLSLFPCAAIARIAKRAVVGSKRLLEFLDTLQGADAVVGSLGIMFADSLGSNSFRHRAVEGKYFGVAKALGKPVIQYTADFGPLKARWNRFFAKFWLGRCVDAIVCRNEASYRCLTETGISPNKLYLAPDTGILMEPAHSEATKRKLATLQHKPLIAIGVSHQVRRRFRIPSEYDSMISSLVQHVAVQRGFGVLVVPNEIHGRENRDDQAIAQRIVVKASSHEVILLDVSKFSGPEVKAILGKCDVVLSSRYHTLVAALSMGIPCMAIGWHHKYQELFRLFGLQDWVFDYSTCDQRLLIDTFDHLWQKREPLRAKINQQLPAVEMQIRRTAKSVVQHLVSLSPLQIKMSDPVRENLNTQDGAA